MRIDEALLEDIATTTGGRYQRARDLQAQGFFSPQAVEQAGAKAQCGQLAFAVLLRHLAGDRREYFEAPKDVWEIFRVLAEERRRREIEPTLSMLRMALLEEPSSDEERHAQERMREMHELIDRLMTWFDDVQRLAPETAMQLMGMGTAVTRVLEFKDRLTGKGNHSPKSNPSGV